MADHLAGYVVPHTQTRTARLIATRCLIMDTAVRIRWNDPVLLSISIQLDHESIKRQYDKAVRRELQR